MQINLKDIVLAFRKYCPDHPLKMIADNFFDETGSFKMILMAEGSWAINSVSAIARPLQFLASHSEKAYTNTASPLFISGLAVPVFLNKVLIF